MKRLSILLFAFVLAFASAVPFAEERADKNGALVRTKQRRWLANDIKEYHQKMRKVRKDYIPRYPDSPVLMPITIGTPPVYYWASMESGSEAIFVLGKDYPGRNVSGNQPFFDPAQSSTAQAAGGYYAFSGDLEVWGTAYEDYVGLFGFGIWENTTQRFGVVDTVYDRFSFYPEMPDGVVGLSWNPKDAANPNENSSAILNLFKEFGWTRIWCDWLTSETDPQNGRWTSGLTSFGYCLEGLCADATPENTYPLGWLESSRSLVFTVDSFTYKDQQFPWGNGKVDTGVPNILVPYDPFLAIISDVQPDYDYEHFLYTVDCSKAGSLPDWVFTIGGNQHAVPSSAYVTDLLLPNGQCALSVLYSDYDTPDYVFGYVFHNLWCIKMDIDNNTISILEAVPLPTAFPELD